MLISHNLHDIFETANRITVLRLGRNVGVFERDKTTQQEVVAGDHGRHADEGLRHSGDGRSDAVSDAEVESSGRAGVARGRSSRPGRRRSARYGQPPSGNLGMLPIVVGLVLHRRLLQLQGDELLHRRSNFINIIVQMAGTCMLAYGVVFVLLLGEIDLSIGYVAGIARRRGRRTPAARAAVHQLNGLVCDGDRAPRDWR